MTVLTVPCVFCHLLVLLECLALAPVRLAGRPMDRNCRRRLSFLPGCQMCVTLHFDEPEEIRELKHPNVNAIAAHLLLALWRCSVTTAFKHFIPYKQECLLQRRLSPNRPAFPKSLTMTF